MNNKDHPSKYGWAFLESISPPKEPKRVSDRLSSTEEKPQTFLSFFFIFFYNEPKVSSIL
jgi:hypothetical protein